jgi:hypothetical protein
MTNISNRERFKQIARFQRPGDLFTTEMVWTETLTAWVQQGAPKQILAKNENQFEALFGNQFFRDYFKHGSKRIITRVKSGINGTDYQDIGHGFTTVDGSPLVPGFKGEVIKEDEKSITFINGHRQTLRAIKGSFSMPMFIDWPVKDRASWVEIKKRLDPHTPARWRDDWDVYAEKFNKQDDPVVLEVGGFFGLLREWIGSEKVLYMFYDDPSLIEDMMDQILYLEIEIIKRVVKDIKVDEADFWEDMAYKAGPLISPKMVRKFIMPRYKKITDLLHSNGIDIIFVDCDGKLDELIPLWLESGINYIWPLEQTAGNDTVAFRKKYGKELILGGAIDKQALLKGKESIKEEVMSKVPFLLEKGGYFPTVDHLVPPGVTFENYCYYINLLREIAGLEKLSF